ncbi:MAG: pyridoxal-phosphate dependent enzyme [Methyloglobulus sp.]|nr:1-aminocyclopropane-1-carboxylate deaminase/D-cysteine desulfhydrase [Methyloglobulus sp.]
MHSIKRPTDIFPELHRLEQSLGRSILTKIEHPLLTHHAVELWLKRDDLLHPIISGNKWRKLKYILADALSLDSNTLISMGGAYSNHLHALAYTGKILGLKTIGIIRGEHPEPLTPTLLEMKHWGMELRFVSRSDYRQLRGYKHWNSLPGIKPNQYWLPEGGASGLALKGIAELVAEIDMPYDVICVACGTGTTMAGLINAVNPQKSVLGFAALKNAGFLQADVQSLLADNFHNGVIIHDYHFGGFAECNDTLASFMKTFTKENFIPLEPVYTGKMLYGIFDLLTKGYFKPGQRIIAVHTGGLQGNRGYPDV